MEIVTVAIGLGLVVSLLLTELFSLAAGGMVVPGYVALFLNKPFVVIMTLLAAVATWLIVRGISSFVIVYGKRRTALMILVGFMIGAGVRGLLAVLAAPQPTGVIQASDFAVIGFIIPGLVAIWIDRQGIVETLSIVLIAGVVVRLLLISLGTELPA